ncbi:hemolysin-III family protein [Apiospora aurea]|uniref:Hemolysin-III family protein n=1 Tax=Apiospora aurea TaxID=335848 RepID=A0ABR1PZI5_9PEZI
MPKRRTATNSPSDQDGNDKQQLLASTPPNDVADRGGWFRAPKLLYFHQIPLWQQDNEYILSGYRPTSESTWLSVASLSYLHNQTINAYSHLIGALIFVSLPYYFYEYVYKHQLHAEAIDLVVVSTYCSGVAICFIFSTAFHVNWNNSKELTALCNKLDYLGILGSPKFRHWRACFYAGFGLSSIIFIVHGLVLHGWELQSSRMSLVWMGWMATSNLVGAAIYATRVPERWAPYRFDLCGASHQLFHIFIIAAAVIHFDGLVVAFRIIKSDQSPCQGS